MRHYTRFSNTASISPIGEMKIMSMPSPFGGIVRGGDVDANKNTGKGKSDQVKCKPAPQSYGNIY